MAKRPSKGKSGGAGSETLSSKKAKAPKKRAVPTSSGGITGVQATVQAGGGGTFLDLSAKGAAMTAAIGDLSVAQDELTVVARGEMGNSRAEALRHLDEIAHLIGQIVPLSPERLKMNRVAAIE